MPIPDDLTRLRQWVCWRYETVKGKISKVPVNALTGRYAKSNDPSTWTDFASACNAVSRWDCIGVGCCFHDDDGMVGIDWDDCLDQNRQFINAEVAAAVQRFASYTEVSPSGTGLKTWVRGKWPKGAGLSEFPGLFGIEKVEVFTGTTRYFTVTGQHVPWTPFSVEPRQEALDWLLGVAKAHKEAATKAAGTSAPAPRTPPGGVAPEKAPRVDAHVQNAASEAPAPESDPVTPEHFGVSTEEALQRCISHLAKVDPAIEGGGKRGEISGHNRTFNVACIIAEFALTGDAAWKAWESFNVRCIPPYTTPDDLRQVARKLAEGWKIVSKKGGIGSKLSFGGRKGKPLPDWVADALLRDRSFGPRDMALMTHIADNCFWTLDEHGSIGRYGASFQRLGQAIGVSGRQAQNIVNPLIDAGLLCILERGYSTGTESRANVYGVPGSRGALPARPPLSPKMIARKAKFAASKFPPPQPWTPPEVPHAA